MTRAHGLWTELETCFGAMFPLGQACHQRPDGACAVMPNFPLGRGRQEGKPACAHNTCPDCGLNAWAKSDAVLLCGTCEGALELDKAGRSTDAPLSRLVCHFEHARGKASCMFSAAYIAVLRGNTTTAMLPSVYQRRPPRKPQPPACAGQMSTEVERGRFRQGVRSSNPQGVAWTGAAVRLYSPRLAGTYLSSQRWAQRSVADRAPCSHASPCGSPARNPKHEGSLRSAQASRTPCPCRRHRRSQRRQKLRFMAQPFSPAKTKIYGTTFQSCKNNGLCVP
jgi:hypothetical protein